MNIEHIGKASFKIFISGAELKKNGLTYDEISGEDPRTVSFISELIRKIYPDEENPPKFTRINVEVFPCEDMGCIMYISPASECTPREGRYVLTISDKQSLSEICRELKSCNTPSCSSVLAEECGVYRLIVRLPENRTLKKRLAEMCRVTKADSHIIAHILEHASIINASDAISSVLSG